MSQSQQSNNVEQQQVPSAGKPTKSLCIDISVGYSEEYMKKLMAFVERQKALRVFSFTRQLEYEMKHGRVLRVYTQEADKLIKLLEEYTPDEHETNMRIMPYMLHYSTETADVVQVVLMENTTPFHIYERRKAEQVGILIRSLNRRSTDMTTVAAENKTPEPSDSTFSEIIHA